MKCVGTGYFLGAGEVWHAAVAGPAFVGGKPPPNLSRSGCVEGEDINAVVLTRAVPVLVGSAEAGTKEFI